MNIVVTVRTLNEEKNINRFCECYKWADHIIVADGGSTDDTVRMALKYENVHVYHFNQFIEKNGVRSNPRGNHINFLIDLAKDFDADWIIFDDCDCVPTLEFQKWARNILESNMVDEVFAYRMFVLYDNQWFPDMNIPGQSLWAWKADVPVRARTFDPFVFEMGIPTRSKLDLEHPYALLHYFYPDDDTFQKKMEMYNTTGELGNPMGDPKRTYGRIESLPDWARWR